MSQTNQTIDRTSPLNTAVWLPIFTGETSALQASPTDRLHCCDLQFDGRTMQHRGPWMWIGKQLCVAATLAIILLAMPLCLGQQPLPLDSVDDEWHFRYELFQMLLEQRGLQISASVDDAIRRPTDSVIVFVGDLKQIKFNRRNEFIEFVESGGTILIATEEPNELVGFGRIEFGPATTLSRKNQYKSFTDCLRIKDLDPTHPMTIGLRQIVTNRSGWLIQNANVTGMSNRNALKWHVIASLPADCLPVESQSSPLISIGTRPVANSGVAVLAADASLFTNNMLWQGENAELALRIANALCPQSKKQLVFVVDGKALPSYRTNPPPQRPPPPNPNQTNRPQIPPNMPEMPPLDPPLPELTLENFLRLTNAAIKDVERSNVVNQALQNQPRSFVIANYYRWIWGLLAAVLVTLLLWKLLRRTNYIPQFFAFRRMRSSHEIRNSSQHPLDRNGPAAEVLARDFCRKLTGHDNLAHWQRYLEDFDATAVSLKLTPHDRTAAKSILELAIYGKKSLISDQQLQHLGMTMQYLLMHLNPKTSSKK
jgi:hypothetical protein